MEKIIEWNGSGVVIGNVHAEIEHEGGTVIVVKFWMRGAGVTLAEFVDFIEKYLDKLFEDVRIGFVMKSVSENIDYSSRSMPLFSAEYQVSVLGIEDREKVFERFSWRNGK